MALKKKIFFKKAMDQIKKRDLVLKILQLKGEGESMDFQTKFTEQGLLLIDSWSWSILLKQQVKLF